MHFTNLSTLYEITGYTDRRSVEKFLRSLNVRLHKVGKLHYVLTEEFENALVVKFGKAGSHPSRKKHIVTNTHEQEFLNDLQKFLSEL